MICTKSGQCKDGPRTINPIVTRPATKTSWIWTKSFIPPSYVLISSFKAFVFLSHLRMKTISFAFWHVDVASVNADFFDFWMFCISWNRRWLIAGYQWSSSVKTVKHFLDYGFGLILCTQIHFSLSFYCIAICFNSCFKLCQCCCLVYHHLK